MDEAFAEIINAKCDMVHEDICNNGYWDNCDNIPARVPTCLALIHSEISEALEADRTNSNDAHLVNRLGLEVELADTVIRIFDLCGALGLDLGGAIEEKIIYNRSRDYKNNGKKY